MARMPMLPVLPPESVAATPAPEAAPETGTPTLEDLNRPDARVYQVERKDLARGDGGRQGHGCLTGAPMPRLSAFAGFAAAAHLAVDS